MNLLLLIPSSIYLIIAAKLFYEAYLVRVGHNDCQVQTNVLSQSHMLCGFLVLLLFPYSLYLAAFSLETTPYDFIYWMSVVCTPCFYFFDATLILYLFLQIKARQLRSFWSLVPFIPVIIYVSVSYTIFYLEGREIVVKVMKQWNDANSQGVGLDIFLDELMSSEDPLHQFSLYWLFPLSDVLGYIYLSVSIVLFGILVIKQRRYFFVALLVVFVIGFYFSALPGYELVSSDIFWASAASCILLTGVIMAVYKELKSNYLRNSQSPGDKDKKVKSSIHSYQPSPNREALGNNNPIVVMGDEHREEREDIDKETEDDYEEGIPGLSVLESDPIGLNNLVLTKVRRAIEEDRLYKDPEFSLLKLSELVAYNRSSLSKMINTYYQTDFSTLVQRLRIEEAKRLMRENHKIKMEAVAYEAGFSNTPNFFSTFKKMTGVTPKVWHEEEQKKLESKFKTLLHFADDI